MAVALATAQIWTIRCAVLAAFAATLYFAGPSAWTVLEKRVRAAEVQAASVDLRRVGVVSRGPDWLDGRYFRRLLANLEPSLRGEVGLLDDDALIALQRQLRRNPLVAEVVLQRAFPNALRVALTLRRPAVVADGVVVAEDGTVLPPVAVALPTAVMPRGGAPSQPQPGQPHASPEVRAAAAVAIEWQTQIATQVEACPALVAVDATNLGYLWAADPILPEVLVELAASDGAPVVFGYGHPPSSRWPRIDSQVKASVLRAVLAEYPGLVGLEAGELRFAGRWRDYLRVRRER